MEFCNDRVKHDYEHININIINIKIYIYTNHIFTSNLNQKSLFEIKFSFTHNRIIFQENELKLGSLTL